MHLLITIKKVLFVPIHPKGWPFIFIAATLALVLFQFSDYAGLLGVVLTLFCVYFFRNPNRMVPQGAGFVLASGDGVISHITQAPLPKELGADGTLYHKVSIFLNVFNVHVNRLPASGRITGHHYIAGKFLNAALDKASDDNERTVTMMETAMGHTIGFAQIAGFVARRIICDLTPQQNVTQGERYGIIRFGSRCDIYMPLSYAVLVDVGSIAVGGETMLGVDPTTFTPAALTWKNV
jgi:phosphatidylserine decarboxylase